MLETDEQRKPTKTIAGVTPIAVVLKPRKCDHGTCLYCPSFDVPQSYTPKSPAIMRAASFEYDAKKQVISRLDAFKAMKHPTEKIELIIMGGTFTQYHLDYQEEFVKDCYDALNGIDSKDLESAKKINETAEHRCVALCIETRPDNCTEKDIKRMLKFGATRCEIGVQAIDDKIYKLNQRGHFVKDVIDATKRLKDAGFKVGYHIMPGMFGSDYKHDMEMYKELFKNEHFQPDQLKIYPCQVLKGSALETIYWQKMYKPLTEKEIKKMLIEMMKITPRYVRIMRIMREIPPEYLVAGTTKIDLRKDVDENLRDAGTKIDEIRFREVGFTIRDLIKAQINREMKLKKMEYAASKGKEIFLEVVNKDDVLFGLCRLRTVKNPWIKELKDALIVRELHVYGPSLKIGDNSIEEKAVQHTGIGKWLMFEAEKIAKEKKLKKISVISGVGVREYYRRMGYELEGNYMVKKICNSQ